jgi:drug/metabolite transporter (DMT)-like permease
VRRGLPHSTPLTAVVISVIFTGAFLWVLAVATDSLSLLWGWHILPFLLGGLFAPGLARLLIYVGIERVGAARASTLSATAPLFAIGLAVVLLGEQPTWGLLAGAGCIVAGGVVLAREGSASRSWQRRDLLFPVLGALGFALRDIVSRWGLGAFPHPALAAVAATTTSMVFIAGFALRRRDALWANGTGLRFLALAGLCEALGSLALWSALTAGSVSAVSPLVHSQPIFTVALAVFFLRDLERVTWRVTLATLAIVGGVAAVIRAGAS